MKKLFLLCLCLFAHTAFSQQLRTQPTLDSLLNNAKQLYNRGAYSLALPNYLQALKIAETKQNHLQTAQILCDVAKCHYSLFDKKTGLKWYYKALKLVDEHALNQLRPNLYYNISVMYNELREADSTLKYHNKAIGLMLPAKDYIGLSKTYAALADIYMNSIAAQNFDEAKRLINKAEHYAELAKDTACLAFVYMKKGLWHYFQKQFKTALPYFAKSENLYRQVKNTTGLTGQAEGIMYAINIRARCLSKMGDTTAYTYMLKWFNFKDSVYQTERAANAAFYETQYQTEKKEQENQLLQQQNKLNQLELQARNRGFFSLLVVLLLLVSVGLWWINRNNLKKKQRELQLLKEMRSEKERISRDLHDSVGAQLSYLITNIEWMLSHPETMTEEEDFNKQLTALASSGRNAMLILREAIWSMGSKELLMEDFAWRFKQYALKMAEFSPNVAIVFEEDIPENTLLLPTYALNIFRICQEAFHNVLKHGKANRIVISFCTDGDWLSFKIEDNGCGFDVDNVKMGTHGLYNMKGRTADIKGKITIESTLGKGTCVTLVVPKNQTI